MLKYLSLNPRFSVSWLQPVDRPVDRSLKAVDRAVDRRAQTCTPSSGRWPVDRPGRPTGRPDRELCSLYLVSVDRLVDRSLKSVDRAVDRRAQTCTPVCTGGPVDRPGRPSRELCSLEIPRFQRALLSVPEARSTDWSTAAPTVRNMTVGGEPCGRPTGHSGSQRLVFLALYIGAVFSKISRRVLG